MATARVIPREELAQTIDFLYDGSTLTVSPQGVKIATGEQVNFSNSSSSTASISISFKANAPGQAMFGTTTSITVAPGATVSLTAANANCSVNYTVSVNGTNVGGPYSIQAGTGPIYVQVLYTAGQGDSSPDPVALPVAGTLEMVCLDPHAYNVGWNTQPFSTPLNLTAQTGNAAHTANVTAGTYTYTLTLKTTPLLGIGGGKVIIQA